MNNLLHFIDKFKFAIIATFAMYIGIFMYLEMETYTQYYRIPPFHEGSVVEVPEEEVEVNKENIEIPPDFQAGEIKNISRDMNDAREKSKEEWSQNKSAQDVEQSVKDYEKKLLEESGGEAERKKIQQEMNDRKNQKIDSKPKPTEKKAQTGGDKSYSGNVMVDWSLAKRDPHQSNNWYVRNPGYTCGYGSTGRVMIVIRVNQNGDVIGADYDESGSSGANGCMIEQALKYAKLSRFNYSNGAAKIQSGTISYTFVSQ
jgi:hypothetical protein